MDTGEIYAKIQLLDLSPDKNSYSERRVTQSFYFHFKKTSTEYFETSAENILILEHKTTTNTNITYSNILLR